MTPKRLVEALPAPVGRMLSSVPHSVRLGPAFVRSPVDMQRLLRLDLEDLRAEVFGRVRCIAQHAATATRLYGELYRVAGVDAGSLRCWEDLLRLPIVQKSDLQDRPLVDRSAPTRGAMLVNTGGSSGTPLEFYLDRNAFAREWAHMLDIWARVGYRPTSLKLTFRGKNLGAKSVRYNAVHNEYHVNAYCSMDQKAAGVAAVRGRIEFVHGYPSAIYEFVRYCRDHEPGVLARLRGTVRGVLLGSEYPAPIYRDLIEQELEAPSISWYGHSEFAVLAGEVERYVYRPFHSYGLAEAVPDGTGAYRLIATSYYNTVSPFVRYDTGDLIEPVIEDGLLTAFRVTSGRVGEFIEDAHGTRISLTALIFGRHHPIFGMARFVQVRQTTPGEATLVVTLPGGADLTDEEVLALFDTTSVAMHFSVELREEPLRTPSGKVPLLVRS